MLTQPQVQRYAREAGLRDFRIAETEVILTFLLQLLVERGILAKLAFKGGTCLRKMTLGNLGRFSTDLDFTALEEHDHENLILEMMAAFEQPYHGIRFAIADDNYYETADGLSWGVNPTYSHDWNASGQSELKFQVSRRETPTLRIERRPQCEQSYFRVLPFEPAEIACLSLPELLAEKIRACYQRKKARDIYDLGMFATTPLNQALIRRLLVLKLWQAMDVFEPQRLFAKFTDHAIFDWSDLDQLVHRSRKVDPVKTSTDCVRGYGFLSSLTPEELELAGDRYQRKHKLWEQLRDSCAGMARRAG
jgi:predicted nucleotidyltransferase component of viral defense system